MPPSAHYTTNVLLTRPLMYAPSLFARVFLDDAARILVLAQSDELGMPQPIPLGPFEEFDLSDGLRPQPHRLVHLLGAEFFAEAWSVRLWEIHEWVRRRHEVLQLREHLSPGGRHESIPRPRRVHQLIPVVIPDDQRVDAVWAGEIPSDHELLPTIHAMLDPRAGAFPGFVGAVPPLPDDALKPLLAYGGQHLSRPSLDVVSDPDPPVADCYEGLQERPPLDERETRKIAALAAQEVEDVVVDAIRGSERHGLDPNDTERVCWVDLEGLRLTLLA